MILDKEDGDNYGYFILRPELAVYPLVGERVTYAEAFAAHSASGTVPIVHISGIATGSPVVTSFGGVPSLLLAQFPLDYGPPEKIIAADITTTYDMGGSNVASDPDGGASVFLVEIMGNTTGYEVGDSSSYGVSATVGSDGGQFLYIGGYAAPYLLSLTDIKIWRISGLLVPPVPQPPAFWTSFIGSREIP